MDFLILEEFRFGFLFADATFAAVAASAAAGVELAGVVDLAAVVVADAVVLYVAEGVFVPVADVTFAAVAAGVADLAAVAVADAIFVGHLYVDGHLVMGQRDLLLGRQSDLLSQALECRPIDR